MMPVELNTEFLLRGQQFRKVIERYDEPIRKQYDLKQIEIEILYFLSHVHGATSTDIYRTLQINKGHVSQGVDGLCKKGYLLMNRDPNDRRYVTFELTEQALPIAEALNETHREMLSELLKDVSDAELTFLKLILSKIWGNATRMMDA